MLLNSWMSALASALPSVEVEVGMETDSAPLALASVPLDAPTEADNVAVGLGDVEKSAAVFVVEESAGAESEQMEGVDGVGPPVPACSEEEGVRVGASVSARVAKGRVRSSKTLGQCLDCG